MDCSFVLVMSRGQVGLFAVKSAPTSILKLAADQFLWPRLGRRSWLCPQSYPQAARQLIHTLIHTSPALSGLMLASGLQTKTPQQVSLRRMWQAARDS